MASGEREPHLRNLLAPHQLLEAFCRTWDPNFDTERPDLTALIGRLDRTHGRDGKKINSDLYACRHAMDLLEDSLGKLATVDEVDWVWPFWRCKDLERQKKEVQRDLTHCRRSQASSLARKLDRAIQNLKKWESVQDQVVEGVTQREAQTVLRAIQQNVHYAFDTRYVVQKLYDHKSAERGVHDPDKHAAQLETIDNVRKWMDELLKAAGSYFEKHYEPVDAPRSPSPPAPADSDTEGHIPITLVHRPHVRISPAAPEPPSASACSSSSEDEGSDDGNFGAPLTRVSSNQPPPPSRAHRARRNSSTRRRGGVDADDLPARRPSLHREHSTVGRHEEHVEGSIGKAGTYRMARRYFGREY